MLEQKLHEQLQRYNQINRYGKTMIMEQEVPPAPPVEDNATETPMGTDPAATPPTEQPSDIPSQDPTADPMAAPLDTPEMDSTEEIDITDLVNMTKNIKKDLENTQQDNSTVVSKMDDLFTKLDDLEQKLGEMDAVMSKIDQLSSKVEEMKPETPVEKLEMRSLDSYPFNEKPKEFFDQKQVQMRQSGKNEYVLTKDEVQNYSPDEIRNSFNPDETEDEFRF